ncbi:MAG: hypothetical protein H6855_07300 [Rhodospirillales bacterium]|nr:hypothetical protein [Rhodospirillales bacterium]MCB9965866.1 hypothetical protein [Rhodospirillales bacterium]MCB9973373.1 hypothetical protein [Rhodospirillales bacterium]
MTIKTAQIRYPVVFSPDELSNLRLLEDEIRLLFEEYHLKEAETACSNVIPHQNGEDDGSAPQQRLALAFAFQSPEAHKFFETGFADYARKSSGIQINDAPGIGTPARPHRLEVYFSAATLEKCTEVAFGCLQQLHPQP